MQTELQRRFSCKTVKHGRQNHATGQYAKHFSDKARHRCANSAKHGEKARLRTHKLSASTQEEEKSDLTKETKHVFLKKNPFCVKQVDLRHGTSPERSSTAVLLNTLSIQLFYSGISHQTCFLMIHVEHIPSKDSKPTRAFWKSLHTAFICNVPANRSRRRGDVPPEFRFIYSSRLLVNCHQMIAQCSPCRKDLATDAAGCSAFMQRSMLEQRSAGPVSNAAYRAAEWILCWKRGEGGKMHEDRASNWRVM